MPWTVKAMAWGADGPKRKTVLTIGDDDLDDERIRMIMYWVRNAADGEKVSIKKVSPEG